MVGNSDRVHQQKEIPHREIAIFWDFENVPLPSWASPADASKAIVSAVTQHGRIVDRRLYFDMAAQGGDGHHWSALDSSGFDLVNTPRRNQKETLDKKMIADILTFAWDSAVRNDNTKPCVVLLTSDGDYAYTLSKLRDRGVMSVVMYGTDASVAKILKAAADIPLSFEGDVLSTIQANTKKRMDFSSGSGSREHNGSAATPSQSALDLCKIALQRLSEDDRDQRFADNNWILGSKLAAAFRDFIGLTEPKDKYRRSRELAIQQGWLERGRKLLAGPNQGTVVVVSSCNNGDGLNKIDSDNLSLEDFLRVTVKGRTEIDGSGSATAGMSKAEVDSNGTKLFIKNVPSFMQIMELVSYLEDEHNVEVIRGNTLKKFPTSSFIFARIELTSSQAAARLIVLARASKLNCRGRLLEVSYDTTKPTIFVDPKYSYERNTGANIKRDDVYVFCKALFAFSNRSGNEGLRDGWHHGGFWNLAGNSILDNDKDRIKKARAGAIEKKFLELGRRLKATNNIEVTGEFTDFSRYNTELYLRLTSQGNKLFQESDVMHGSRESEGLSHVFIKNLPLQVEVTELVEFLETTHSWSVRRAAIESTPTASTSGQAHVEFTITSDAGKMLRAASGSDGLLFNGRPLIVVPDLHPPTYDCNDPRRFYESNRLPDMESQSHRSTETPPLGNFEASLFCRAIYDGCTNGTSSAGNSSYLQQWKNAANVAEVFQRNLKRTSEESKEAYKRTRDYVISEGLVEMGRRILTSQNRDVALVPQGRTPPNMSKESYLRLTSKGVHLADSTPTPEGESAGSAKAMKNLFVQNLPRNTNICDFVHYLESSLAIKPSFACLDGLHPSAKSATAHIEFGKAEDYNRMSKIGKDHGLVYGGRSLYVKIDKAVPRWTECKPNLLYERMAEQNHDEELSSSMEKEEAKTGGDDEGPPQRPTKEKSFENTNLLFGDNLALLYAQGAHTTRTPSTSSPSSNEPEQQARPSTEYPCFGESEDRSSPQQAIDFLWE